MRNRAVLRNKANSGEETAHFAERAARSDRAMLHYLPEPAFGWAFGAALTTIVWETAASP